MMNELIHRRGLMQKRGGILPSEYQQVNYISSNGAQWFDTRYIFDSEICKYEYRYSISNFNAVISELGCNIVFGTLNNYVGRVRYGTNTIAYNAGTATVEGGTNWGVRGQLYSIMAERDAFNTKIDCDELSSHGTVANSGSIIDNLSIYMFAVNKDNNPLLLSGAILCIAFCKIWDNNYLVRDFVPCIRKSDNKPGMFDLVSREFFVNQGTGEFGYEKMDGTIINPI